MNALLPAATAKFFLKQPQILRRSAPQDDSASGKAAARPIRSCRMKIGNSEVLEFGSQQSFFEATAVPSSLRSSG